MKVALALTFVFAMILNGLASAHETGRYHCHYHNGHKECHN